jgi:hypothetical protein
MKDKGSQVGWDFWLKWVVATSVGSILGLILGFGLGLIIGGFDNEFGVLRTILGKIVFGAGIGFGVGILQWLVLRGRVTRAGWWVLASTAGLAVAQGGAAAAAVASGNSEVLGSSLFLQVMALGGAVTGILQWLVLRGKVSRAGWWVLASTVGWGLGFDVMDAALVGVDCIIFVLFYGAVLGVVTGGALVWLLRQPVPVAQLE